MATTKTRRSGLASMLPDIKDALAGTHIEVGKPEGPEESPAPLVADESVPSRPVEKPSPAFESFERKEARLRQNQLDDLEALRKKINRTKIATGGERITDNTLIRIAVDMLLANSDKLKGSTERELRMSIGL